RDEAVRGVLRQRLNGGGQQRLGVELAGVAAAQGAQGFAGRRQVAAFDPAAAPSSRRANDALNSSAAGSRPTKSPPTEICTTSTAAAVQKATVPAVRSAPNRNCRHQPAAGARRSRAETP